jgi:hypothetical protein
VLAFIIVSSQPYLKSHLMPAIVFAHCYCFPDAEVAIKDRLNRFRFSIDYPMFSYSARKISIDCYLKKYVLLLEWAGFHSIIDS